MGGTSSYLRQNDAVHLTTRSNKEPAGKSKTPPSLVLQDRTCS